MSTAILLGTPADAGTQQKTPSPFPGLRPFEPEESELFFGREDDIQDILDRLRRTRFLAVVGSSGCGKSSVVRAGVVASLQDGFMADGDAPWRIAIMRPGSNPIAQLAAALCRPGALPGADEAACDAEDVAMAQATLRRGARGLIEEVESARLPPNSKLLLLVDQFEELFRFTRMEAEAKAAGKTPAAGDAENVAGTGAAAPKPSAAKAALDAAEEARAFIKLLLAAAAEPSAQVYVVLTMRSEFLGYCALLPGLPDAINSGLYLLPQMSRDQFRDAIVEPVRAAGGRISPRLVNRMLNDLGDGTDQLPVLQHTLLRLWVGWRDTPRTKPIDLDEYEAVGGLHGSISKHAEEIFESLSVSQQLTAERLFRLITDTTPDNQQIRRPLKLARIRELFGVTQLRLAGVMGAGVAEVIEKFRAEGRSFLMPPCPELLTPDSVIDISHESLIRQWGRLKGWAEAEMRETRAYRRLVENARAWDEEGRKGGGLYTGSRLVEAEEWVAAHPDRPLSQTERDFLRTSRRSANLRRNVTFFAVVIAWLAVVAGAAYVVYQRNDALSQRAEALKARDLAQWAYEDLEKANKRADEQKELLKTAYRSLFGVFGGVIGSIPPEEFDKRMTESLDANAALQEVPKSGEDIDRRSGTEVRIFIKGKADEKAVKTEILKDVLEETGFPNVSLEVSNARSARINSVWGDTREVDISDMKAVAYTFIRAGFQIRFIGPYPDPLKTRRQNPTIRVGSDPDIVNGTYRSICRPLTVKEIKDATTLPICIAP